MKKAYEKPTITKENIAIVDVITGSLFSQLPGDTNENIESGFWGNEN